MFRARSAKAIIGKTGYAMCCVLAVVVLVVSGFAHYVEAQVDDIGVSNAVSGSPSVGEMNILVMGLESRTDYDGNVLPAGLLDALHAGSVEGVEDEGVGGQDTNTLILIHIFAGGQKAIGFSIPRDDWVTFPKAYDGQPQGKIDQAYGLAYAQSLNQTANSSMSRDQRYFLANEAGQAAEIATVEAVTGQHVDHFAEVNLAGYYELAQAFDGVEVCVKSWNDGENLHDANSGADLKVGYQHLGAGQALAFVRERDNLPDGDLSRTHRQQAIIDYVVWKLKHQGVFTSLGQLTHLLSIVKQYVITDSSWHLLDFATEMQSLNGRNMTFETLPIVGYQTYYLGGTAEDANNIDIPAIQVEVKKAFTAPPAAPAHKKSTSKPKPKVTYPLSATTVDVYNAGYTAGLASEVAAGLVGAGFKQGQVGNATATQSTTQVLYGTGAAAEANAAKAAALFGVTAQPGSSVSAGQVEVILGTGATLPSFSSLSSGSSSSSSTSTSTPTSGNGDSGGVLAVSANAPYGIPCVY
jgi:LCP family protein required for cell wall assembly